MLEQQPGLLRLIVFLSLYRYQIKRRRSSRWLPYEKKTLLAVLDEFGHKNIRKIASYLPSRTEKEIALYLRRHQKSALQKFKSKKRLQEQQPFTDIHPWMSFVNVHCNCKANIHDHLVAYIVPIFERYATLPTATFGEIDFK